MSKKKIALLLFPLGPDPHPGEPLLPAGRGGLPAAAALPHGLPAEAPRGHARPLARPLLPRLERGHGHRAGGEPHDDRTEGGARRGGVSGSARGA